MRKNFFLPLLCLLLLSGCASLKAERKVEGNVFSSSYPKMVIEVSEDYEFVGREKKAIDTQYMHLSGGATATLERFMWRSHSGVLIIEFRKGRGGVPWVDPAQEWTVFPNVQDTGQQKIGKYGYDYCVLQEKDGRFMKIFSRNFSGDSLRAHIVYHSSLSTLNLNEFEEDCRNAFTVAGQKLPKTDLQQELEKESFKIASVPEGIGKMPLRTESKKLMEKDIRRMLAKYDFYDDDLNWRGSFANDFEDHGDGTITDRATGLMWQKSGSAKAKSWRSAKLYVDELNGHQFAGYSDWRLPTIEELASLLEKGKKNGLHIDPVFDRKQERCWSKDSRPESNLGYGQAGLFATWIGHFSKGRIIEAKWTYKTKTDLAITFYEIHPENYVRLVRSSPESTARVSLRTEPKKLLDKDIRKMLARYDFYDDNLNWRGSFANDFADNGDGTITDKATGLMWQKSGSAKAKSWRSAKLYVDELNGHQFAGYSDWRLPTIEELASLVEREKVNGVHIDPVFNSKQKTCWSADYNPTSTIRVSGYEGWIVKFEEGTITQTIWSLERYHGYESISGYIRAVRSAK